MPSPLVRRPVSATLLGQLLDDPELPARVRALPAPALRQLVLRVGLEDAGELIALSTPEQLRDLFDEDLWRSAQPGLDESFDARRFAVWIEVLHEAGDAFAAERLAQLSEDFLAFALSRLVRVIDTSELLASSPAAEDDGGELDRLLDAELCQELDEYLIVSRIEHGWDALWASLLALDEAHGTLLRAVLHRCWLATRERVDRAGGLGAALSEAEVMLEDAGAGRDERRSRLGYVSPADARAFLGLAQQGGDPFERDPITRAYFRELSPAPGNARTDSTGPGRAAPLGRLLPGAGPDPDLPPPLPTERSLLRRVMAELWDADPHAHQRVVDELTYLANVLVAGDRSRAFSPAEAAERVLSLCDAGLRRLLEREQGGDVRALLLRAGAVGLFRVAWAAEPAEG